MNERLQRLKALLTWQVLPPLSAGIKRKIKAAARWCQWLMLVLFILGIVTWTVLNWVGSRNLEAALSTLRESSYATRLEELAPPPVQPDENAAPFYSAAFALFAKPSPRAEQKAFGEVLAGLSTDGEAVLRAWLGRNHDAFELVARARTRPHCRFDRKYEGYATRFPEISNIPWLTGALAVRAQFLAKDGRLEEARDSVSDILRLADSLADEPSIICQMFRQSIIGNALTTINRCVVGDTDADALRQWLAILPREDSLEGSWERPLRAELATLAESLPLSSYELWDFAGQRKEEDLGRLILTWLSNPIQRLDGVRSLSFLRRAAELSRKPYAESQSEQAALQEEVMESSILLHPITRLVLPGLGGLTRTQAYYQAQIAVTRTGLAWELEYVTKGRYPYPEKIEAIDPFSGKPLSYNVKEGRLYSVGSPYRSNITEDRTWLLRRRR
jgi:hypothetical protein